MFGLSKIVALMLAFTLGFAVGAGALVGGVAIALSSFTVRDLERNGIPIPDEAFIGENPEVDILDLTAIEFFDEIKELQTFGDDLTINFLKDRYALIFPEIVNDVLSEDTRNMPLKTLFSEEGVHNILGTVYIGNVENYICYNADGTEGGDPKDETSYWVNPTTGHTISGIEDIIADFSLDDFLRGNINTDNLLGDIYISDVLGYKYDESLGYWVDKDGNRVTGVMAVFADCHINEVSSKMNTVELGELLGYVKGDEDKWYETNENGELVAVSGFMNKIADGSIQGVDDIFGTLAVGDIVPEEDRTGIFSIIPADTEIDEIGSTVNDSIMKSPLQFFINEGLITFENEQNGTKKDMSKNLDDLSVNVNDLVTIKPTDADFETQEGYYKSVWTEVKDDSGNVAYTVPAWRTQPLNTAFAYIISLLTPSI